MGLLSELQCDYENLSTFSINNKIEDNYIFNEIGKLDKKYRNLDEHFNSIEGLICNIGKDQKSIRILNYAIKRLKDKKDKLNSNKYHYDLGNSIYSKALLGIEIDNKITSFFNFHNVIQEAKINFCKVRKDKTILYEKALTNLSNIYSIYGRNYEAINLYSEVLKSNPKFGIALGQKAISIAEYTVLAPQQSFLLLNTAYNLLKSALNYKHLT